MSPPGAAYGILWGVPFLGLLLTIAVAPQATPRLWHRRYGWLAGFWMLAFLLPDAFESGAGASFATVLGVVLRQYLPFVLLLGSLFTIAGGIAVRGTPFGSPGVNTALLAIGTVVSSCIGTPGAAMLMVRPLIRANRSRRRAEHVFVFFIFLVCNAGGALTPLGNPPLFLGYLEGVPFFWPARHLLLPTLVLSGGLLAVFYVLDSVLHRRGRRPRDLPVEPAVIPEIEKLRIEGGVNLGLLALAAAAVMLRSVWSVPGGVAVAGIAWSFDDIIADGLLLGAALLSVALTRRETRRVNGFTWGPMLEVAILFGAIFVTLVPVSAMVAAGASGPAAPLFARLLAGGVPDNPLFYRLTGALSAFLDNAPAYLVFFELAGNDAALLTGKLAGTLTAISLGAVYFGALTYLGNAPNLMVKAVVESQGLRMPGFFGYIGWALVFLLPWLMLIEALFLH